MADRGSIISLKDALGLTYYCEVDRYKLRPLKKKDVSKLRSLTISENNNRPTIAQYLYYLLFLKTGSIEDLNQAIRQDIDNSKPDYQNRLKDLIVLLVTRYQRTNSVADLELARLKAHDMVIETDKEHPDHPDRTIDWIHLMLLKYRHTGAWEDLDRVKLSVQQIGGVLAEVKHSDGEFVLQARIPKSNLYSRPQKAAPAARDTTTKATGSVNTSHSRFDGSSVLASPNEGINSAKSPQNARGKHPTIAPYPSPEKITASRVQKRPSNLSKGGIVDELSSQGSQNGSINAGSVIGQQPSSSSSSKIGTAKTPSFIGPKQANSGDSSSSGSHKMTSGVTTLSSSGPELSDSATDYEAERLKVLRLSEMADVCADQFEETGNMASLNLAIQFFEQAIEAASVNHPGRPFFFNNLGYMLCRRFEITSDLVDLKRGIEFAKKALDATPEGHAGQPLRLRNYGDALGRMFKHNGDVEYLKKAIKFCEEALAVAAPDDVNLAPIFGSLSDWYVARFEWLGNIADVDLAVELSEKAVALPEAVNYDKAARLGTLCIAYRMRYNRIRSRKDLDRLIEAINEAIKLLEVGHPHLPTCLNMLGNGLRDRLKLTRDMSDATAAVKAAEDALALLTPSHSQLTRGKFLVNLGIALSDKFQMSRDISEMNRSIDLTLEGLNLIPRGNRDRDQALSVIAHNLWERSFQTGSMDDTNRAIKYHKEALDSPTITPFPRIRTCNSLGKIFALNGNWKEATMLTEFSDLASTAAAAALEAGKDGGHALQLLELGRGVIAGMLMDMRGDISELQQQHPNLAKSFISVRDRLDAPFNKGSASKISESLTTEQEFNRVLDKIRKQPGYQNFLLPLTVDEMKAAANPDPIVVVNRQVTRCDAIIVQHDKIRVLKLPKYAFDPATLIKKLSLPVKSQRLLFFGHEMSKQIELMEDVYDSKRIRHGQMESHLAWLWEALGKPVLEALGFTKPNKDGNWPRVWWVPTGDVSQVPIHAAGIHEEGSADTVMDRVMSSYATSIKALVHARRQQSHYSSENAVLVCMEKTPGIEGSLPLAKAEISMLEGMCPSLGLKPITTACTKEAVLKNLKDCRIFHFAGHGVSDPTNSARSSLLLKDWKTDPLTMEDLRNRKLHGNAPFLGYLSACSTGVTDSAELADEGMHLIGAFQLAGFRHVVGTLWEVKDDSCIEVASILYKTLQNEGMLDKSVCKGLHLALRALRNKDVDRKSIVRNGEIVKNSIGEMNFDWAPYVHFGV
ncbi:hypothetical protein TWF694_003518 [Orbilia ellipsospora]|uniref:CHAT domain-containing protein n=1 Tax=Orbilia ellipsospora TaxID=2528407 RepID=A0AAV9WYR6_9PEZI